jgi:hypothetical protein
MSTTGDNHVVSAEDFIRVSTAKKRYFGGAMSLRWWYRQIEEGRLPHFRAGATVLLRPADVEAFVAKMFRTEAKEVKEAPEPPPPAANRHNSRPAGGLRFFPADN